MWEREKTIPCALRLSHNINEFCISVVVYQNQIYSKVRWIKRREEEKEIDWNDILWKFVTIWWLNVSFALFELKFTQVAHHQAYLQLTKWWFGFFTPEFSSSSSYTTNSSYKISDVPNSSYNWLIFIIWMQGPGCTIWHFMHFHAERSVLLEQADAWIWRKVK